MSTDISSELPVHYRDPWPSVPMQQGGTSPIFDMRTILQMLPPNIRGVIHSCNILVSQFSGKSLKTVETLCHIVSRLKCTKFDFSWGCANRCWVAHSIAPGPLAGQHGAYFCGEEREEEEEGKGRGEFTRLPLYAMPPVLQTVDRVTPMHRSSNQKISQKFSLNHCSEWWSCWTLCLSIVCFSLALILFWSSIPLICVT